MNSDEYYFAKLSKLPDAKDRTFARPPIPENVKKVHITGVCGKLMSALAGILKSKGYEVTGSDDTCLPPVSDFLSILKIESKPFHFSNVADVDVIVVGNACGPSNVELVYARENNVPQISIPEAMQYFLIHDRTRLVVAGTHGKTTTTGLLAHIFDFALADPGFMVGGVMQGKQHSFSPGTGQFFIIEGDEYDTAYFDKKPKFLHYKPHGLIVTSLELDHLDIYSDLEDYKKAFQFLVADMPSDGILVPYGDDQNTRRLSEIAPCQVLFYGLSPNDQIYYRNLHRSLGMQIFTLVLQDKTEIEITTTMPGRYNVLNICAVAGLCYAYGIPAHTIAEAIKVFPGMRKRQEEIGMVGDITVIDDYAHHPTAVRFTIQGIREKYGHRRIVALFEPRSNSSRRKDFEQDYIKSFDEADLVFIKAPAQRHNDETDNLFDVKEVVGAITKRGTLAYHFETTDEVLEKLRKEVQSGDIILIMSNGDFDGVQGKVLSMLEDLHKLQS